MITVFWESKALLLEHYEGRGSTMNSARHSKMQCDKLKPAIEANEEDCCQKALCCCTTMPILTLLPILLKPLRD